MQIIRKALTTIIKSDNTKIEPVFANNHKHRPIVEKKSND